MLKKIKLLSLIIFSFILASCGKYECYGLTPGYYYFQSYDGYLPAGWSFDVSSYFEFKKADVEDATKDDVLQDGQWQMPRVEPKEDGNYMHDSNYIMQWYNTPFNNLSPIGVGGAFRYLHGGANVVMYVGASSVNKWENYLDSKSVFCFFCQIDCIDNNPSKRKLTINILFLRENGEQCGWENGEKGCWTNIVFSM